MNDAGSMIAMIGIHELILLGVVLSIAMLAVSFVRSAGSETTDEGGAGRRSLIWGAVIVIGGVYLIQFLGRGWHSPGLPGFIENEFYPRGYFMRGELVPITFIIVVGVVMLSFVRMLAHAFGGRGERRRVRDEDSEETRLIQEMHRNLGRLEDRIESLETLIVDRERRAKDLDE